MTTITDILGRTREQGHTYDDGSYSCPFCGAAVMPNDFSGDCRGWRSQIEGLHCHNPACAANPHIDPESMRQQVAEQERRQAEREADKARWEIAKKSMEDARTRRDEKWRLLAAECDERGACRECLRKSNWEYGTPKFIKHRESCPRQR